MNVVGSDTIEVRTLAEEGDQPAPELVFGERTDAVAEYTHADVSKTRASMGYEPTRSIREGVGDGREHLVLAVDR